MSVNTETIIKKLKDVSNDVNIKLDEQEIAYILSKISIENPKIFKSIKRLTFKRGNRQSYAVVRGAIRVPKTICECCKRPK